MCCWVGRLLLLLSIPIMSVLLYRQSASCTHVSALLHALSALNTTSVFRPCMSVNDDEEDEASIPCTSKPCQWKPPRKRKESTLRLSDASFEKHDYAKPVKRKVQSVEDFDPRPEAFRGTASSKLPQLLKKLKGEQLCISLLFDLQYQCEAPKTPLAHNTPSLLQLKKTISAFKETLEVTAEKAREIERRTREQLKSPLWYEVRRYRITASMFGSVLSRKPETPPRSLVLRIIQAKTFSTPATAYGIEMEECAIKEYVSYQHDHGHQHLMVTPSGVVINPIYPFLGASPDGAVYDPSNPNEPYGFLEVKCPYTAKTLTPTEACDLSGFCCRLSSSGHLELRESHQYYAQVQGQMAVGERPWCDFVVYTPKGINVQRIPFSQSYWKDKLLPKLTSFYDNCVAPELVSPVHSLGFPIRDLSKI